MVDMKVTNQALPQGVPNGLTELQKMLTNITDEIAVSESLTGYMTPNPLLVQAAQSSGSFKISTSKMSGLGDYSRFKGSALGAVTNTWEEYKCRYDRARSFVLDNVDVMTNDGLISASSALSQFMREEVVPELDATRIATCAQTAITATSTVEKAPAKASFLTDITTGMNAVKKALKLRTTQGMKIHVSDKYIDILEGSSEFNRTKDITAGIRRLDTGVDMINQAEIIYTPEEYMFSKFDYATGVTSTEPEDADDVPAGGFSKASDAKEIAALIVAPGVANALVASEATQIFPPGTVPGVFGSQIDYRVYHDCLILKNKQEGLYAITVPASGRDDTETTVTTMSATATTTKARTAAKRV